jgi:type II secretory pathway component PulC
MRLAAHALVLAALSCGCANTRAVAPAAQPAPASPASSGAQAASAPAARAPGPLTRAEVEALVAQGLGTFLARVEVSPVFARGRFVGFRLDSAEDLEAWRAAGADVQVGDVILRVNGIRIERPEQALWAFERLRIAHAIEVDLLRDGAPRTVRSPILDSTARTSRE